MANYILIDTDFISSAYKAGGPQLVSSYFSYLDTQGFAIGITDVNIRELSAFSGFPDIQHA